MDFSKKVVAGVILLNVAFVLAIFYLAWLEATMPSDAVIIAWFAFTTGELWTLSRITQTKVREEGRLSGAGCEIATPGIADESGDVYPESEIGGLYDYSQSITSD